MNLSAKLPCLRGVLLIAGFIFIIHPVQAQREYDLLGKGARAAGMAYAFTAIADDATAISWNPAGIVQIKKPEIALVNSLTAIKLESRMEELNYNPVYMPDYLGFVYPLKLKSKDLVFGLSLQNTINFKYNYTSVPSELTRYEANCNLTVNAVTLCGAYSINRFLAAGFSFNQWFSLGSKEYTYQEYNYIDTSHLYIVHKNLNFSGKNITAGILLDFASVHFPLRLALKYENKFILKKDFDEVWDVQYIYAQSEGELWNNSLKGVEKFYIPQIITTGISYRLGDYFTVACDLEFRLFNGKYYGWNYRWIEKYITGNQITALIDTVSIGDFSFDQFDSKLNQYRFGMEYILHPRFALIPIRAGWKNNLTSLYDYKDSYADPNQVYAHSLNFGTGCITKRFSVDFAYEQYKFERTNELDNHEEKIISYFLLSAIIYLK